MPSSRRNCLQSCRTWKSFSRPAPARCRCHQKDCCRCYFHRPVGEAVRLWALGLRSSLAEFFCFPVACATTGVQRLLRSSAQCNLGRAARIQRHGTTIVYSCHLYRRPIGPRSRHTFTSNGRRRSVDRAIHFIIRTAMKSWKQSHFAHASAGYGRTAIVIAAVRGLCLICRRFATALGM